MLMIVSFLIAVGLTNAYTGAICYKDGIAGKCTAVSMCETAIKGIQNGNYPKICSYNDASLIVCCVEYDSGAQSEFYSYAYTPLPIGSTTLRWPYNYFDAVTQKQFYNVPTAPPKAATATNGWNYNFFNPESPVRPETATSSNWWNYNIFNPASSVRPKPATSSNWWNYDFFNPASSVRPETATSSNWWNTNSYNSASSVRPKPATAINGWNYNYYNSASSVQPETATSTNGWHTSSYNSASSVQPETATSTSEWNTSSYNSASSVRPGTATSSNGWNTSSYNSVSSVRPETATTSKWWNTTSYDSVSSVRPETDNSTNGWTHNYDHPVTQSKSYNTEGQTTAPPKLVPTTVHSNSKVITTTTAYIPETYDYEENTGQLESTCLSSKKTGNKAWDKCVEYHEQLVDPCERSVADDGFTRKRHCHHIADALVVGGNATSPHEFPHMVMLGYGDQWNDLQWLCGGSLISERFVMTAGHCTGTPSIGNVTYVLVNAHSRSDSANRSKIHKVKRIIKYPDYKHFSKYNDLALLETETKIKLSQFVVPACLPAGDPMDESRASATGWGLTSFAGSPSEELLKVILSKFEAKVCAAKFPVSEHMKRGFDENTQMCYGDTEKSRDTCQGDSGGPLQVKSEKIDCMYVVIGVTSFGTACGIVGEPGVYTRVAPFVSWIENIVWS